MAESYMKYAPSAHAVGESSSASGTKVVSLGRTRLQRAKARNTSRSSSNTSGSASIRITRSQSAKEYEISGSKSVKEPEIDVSQNNIKTTKKRKVSESTIHKRRHSKSFLKLSASDRPILGSNFNSKIVSNLKTKLSTMQLELFKSTCFGYLLNLSSIKLQTQLIYYLLTKEVEKGNVNEMAFLVNVVKLRFGLAEFACVSGLKCTGDVQFYSEATQKNNRLIAKYFMDYPSISKEHLVDCFLTKTFESDEDAIKIAVLFVINSFLFSIKNTKLIDMKYLDLVDKSDYNSYPWGIDVYEETIWFYECFEYLHNFVAHRCQNTSPPILRWSVTRQLKFEELNDKLYGLSSEKLNLRNMSLENEIADNVDQKHVSSDDDFVDHPLETLKTQYKMMTNVNAKRQRKASNVLEKKGKDVNNLKNQGKATNEISKMKSIDANDLEKKMIDNKEVSSLRKEYKEELVVLKNNLAEKFVEVFNAINSMKKSMLEHHHNGDVKKDVEGDSDRKQDAFNENKEASGFVDVGIPYEDKWFEMCDLEAHKLTGELCKLTRNEDIPSGKMTKESFNEDVPAVEVYKKSSTKMIPDHEFEMTDTQIDCQIHKLTSKYVNESIGVAPVMTTTPKCSTPEEDVEQQELKNLLYLVLLLKGDHPFKISITEEILVSIRDDVSKFVQTKLIQTRRKKGYEKKDDILEEEFDLGIEFIAKKT
ncbi:uncharacterized protein [Nicotiana sylvestris]|uniref:uncharacterized protein n=1 Tax=Nicotiana sylvestris TaxID=4096 RepID=UPI00388C4790